MRKEDIYIPGEDYDGEDLTHGRPWSEEAKQRVREARRAGRSVYEMFSNFYNSQKKNLNPRAISKGINRIGNNVNRVARKAAVNVNRFGKALKKVKNKVVRSIDNAVYTKKERNRNKKEIAKLRGAVKRSKGLIDRVPPSERAAMEKQLKSDTAKLNKKLKDTHKQYKKSINSKVDRAVDSVNKVKKKVQRTIDDINTNGGKGYRDPLSKKSYAERITGKTNGKITSDKYESYEEGKRYDKLTDMITRKNGQKYKVYEQADLTKKKNKKKKKKVNKHVTFNSYESAARHSGLSDVYIPGKTGSSDVILHTSNYWE